MDKTEFLKQYNVDVEGALSFFGDINSYNEGLEEFKNSLKDKLKELEYYKDNHDYDNYGILAHSTKSEAKYLGFMKEAEIFLQHEMAGKEKDQEFINSNFNMMEQTINKIYDILTSYFDNCDNKKRIVIADDSNIMLNFIEHNIGEEYKIIRANNGEEAINHLNDNVYALLLDLNMPGVNGFQVLEYMKENNLFDKFPVVIITGDDTLDTIQKAFTYPILDVLNKPFKEENIKRVLQAIKSFYEKK